LPFVPLLLLDAFLMCFPFPDCSQCAPEPAEPEEAMDEAKGEDADSFEAAGDSRDGEKADRDINGESREKGSA
jgi:hypothetical protein